MFGGEKCYFNYRFACSVAILRGRQIFRYDSDRLLIFKNRNIIPFLTKEAKDEFPKYKLISYEVVNAILFKKLFIKLKVKRSRCYYFEI